MIIECNCCGNMSFQKLTCGNITGVFVCQACKHHNEYPFNTYADSEYDDIMEYQAAKKAALEFEEYFSNM